MKTCKNCGAELNDEAVICRECGETQTLSVNKSDDSMFAMPYLSANADTGSKKSAPKKKDAESSEISDEAISESDSDDNDNFTDPLEIAFAKRDRRNKIIRITALIIACVMILSTGAYFIFRNKGYHRTLEKYIEGRTTSGGTNYLSIVPELYLINAEKQYDMRRPEIKSTTNNYLEYVENQYAADYGSGLEFKYKISSERTVSDEASLEVIESSILSSYNTELDISEAAYVSIILTTKGSVTQSTENKSLTFYKYDGKWYSLDAMEIVKFACDNSGYNVW